MNPREVSEDIEERVLSKYAMKSKDSRGRIYDEKSDDIRTQYARDRDRIIHSKAFRRLKHKTQVFILTDNDHFRTRLTHTLEVSQIARTIAKALRLNEELVEAVSLGHDLGHTPFGHSGERCLNRLNPNGFKHYRQSLRVVDCLEKLNLTYEVRDGIENHTGENMPATHEGMIVKYADKIAYINHDIDDAVRAGIMSESDIPHKFTSVLGNTSSNRINTLITDIIANTERAGRVCLSEEIDSAMMGLRQFMFDNVYTILSKDDFKVDMIIDKLYDYYKSNPGKIYDACGIKLDKCDIDTYVCDYIAGMTDYYCIERFNELFMPKHI